MFLKAIALGDVQGFFGMNTQIVDIDTLISHERVNASRLRVVRNKLMSDGNMRRAVIVDRETRVILDGHHRVRALKELGIQRVPVYFVRYFASRVRVYLRRKNLTMLLLKQAVVQAAKNGEAFPYKTTRHAISNRPYMKPVSLSDL